MILFDSHCHLDDTSFNKDLADVMDRAARHDVKKVMVAGINTATSQKAIQIAGQYPGVVTSVGIHPHDSAACTPEQIRTLTALAKANACVKAWGETGLDFNRMYAPVEDQENCLILQLEAAGRLDLPLIFHERDSEGRLLEIIRAHAPVPHKGVIHCFSGTEDELFQYLDLGYHIGITGILTIQKRGKTLRELAVLIPEDRILIETDAPYLTPAPHKNKVRRNEPAFVRSVLLRLAELRQTDPDRLSDAIFKNTCTLFGVTSSDGI